ncbi:uncharacterized protein [Paramisgurnus dabryanus]|uniref:uncharacterized protein n=1 Tax=Paramisgurnus dabryanus TaxID=90735 RepID=UPI003CCF1B40
MEQVQSSMSTQVQNPGEHTDQSLKIAGYKYYIPKPEKTYKCYEDIIGKFPKIPGLKKVKSVEECDFLVVFCMIVSRAGTDIEAALKELNKLSDSKTAIFMVLHHTFDREKTVPDSSRSVNRKNTLTVDLLFYEDELLLECMKNTEALERIEELLLQDPDPEEIDFLLVDKEAIIASELLIVLLGMSGSGKSAARSMIFGRDERSQTGVSTATQKITKERGILDRDQVSVLDTPDWFSSGLSMEQIKPNIQLISMCSSGPYAFLLVIPIKNEFTEEEREMVKKMEMIFEEISWERVMILFIITDEQENQNIDQSSFLQHPSYQELVKKCGKRFHLFSFSQIGNRDQVPELLEKIKKMVGGNVSDVCKEDKNQTTSKTNEANEPKDEREINYIKVQLPKSQRTVWTSECPKIENPEVLSNLKQRLPENSETCDSDEYEFLQTPKKSEENHCLLKLLN